MKYITKSEYIYQKLKDAIIDGEYKEGERLIIADITEKYKISPMPAREAITKLEKYGYVTVEPHVGASVSAMNITRITEIMLLRLVIEPLCARLAVPYIDNNTIIVLDDLLLAMQQKIEDGDSVGYEKLNKIFHNTIYEKNPYLYIKELNQELWGRSEITKMLLTKLPARLSASFEEHKLWLEAIKKQDEDEVERIVRIHKTNAFELFKTVIHEK